MKKLIVLLLAVGAAAGAAPSKKSARKSAQGAAQPSHPLDPLTPAEIKASVEILRKGYLNSSTLLPYLVLKEPPKQEVLSFNGGANFRREALAVIYDRRSGKLVEATVDLKTRKVADTKVIEGMQPPVMLSEFDAVPPIVKADPRFKQAMLRRGIKNLDDVAVDVWAYGSPDTAQSKTARLLRAIAYFKGKDKNFYARPIDGFTAIVNMNERKVEKVIDTAVYPVPPESADFDDASLARLNGGKLEPRRRPLVISQPRGADFTVRGNEVRWHNWSFRFAMHPREGLVLYTVKYNDRGHWRSVLYRASLADMMVPYGHNDEHWTYRAAFDEGEYGIGRYSGSLDVGADVPDNARLFDATFVDDFGKPYTTKNAVGLWERDGGLLWKHFDMYNGGNVSRRGRDLVIGFITTISNYDYGLNWIFKEDGTIELDVVLSGIMLTKNSNVTSVAGGHDHNDPDLQFAHLVAPNVVAPHHQHFFNVRLDLDVDGTENSVAELETGPAPGSVENPAGNAFVMTETAIQSEARGARDLNFASQRKWKVFNPNSRTPSLGYARGYILVPGANSVPYLTPKSPLLTRGGFVSHHVWLTHQDDNELYAAGTYPTQRPTSEGLPEWIKKNRPLENSDVVLWYTFALTHAPRPEEWPVMVAHRIGFQLIPAGFFDRNPALGVRR
jgi:primary-amine oxidase